jgi:transcriptional regulator with XRE-family HTH domain
VPRLARRQGPEYRWLAQRLRSARLECELTQESVASTLGKSQSFLAKVESAERRIDFLELVALAEIYKKPLSYFVPPD